MCLFSSSWWCFPLMFKGASKDPTDLKILWLSCLDSCSCYYLLIGSRWTAPVFWNTSTYCTTSLRRCCCSRWPTQLNTRKACASRWSLGCQPNFAPSLSDARTEPQDAGAAANCPYLGPHRCGHGQQSPPGGRFSHAPPTAVWLPAALVGQGEPTDEAVQRLTTGGHCRQNCWHLGCVSI